MTEKELSFASLGITAEAVCKQMGYPVEKAGTDEGVPVPVAVLHETQGIIAAVEEVTRPRFCYHVVSELPPTFHVGNVIGRQLRDSDAYALFIATAGMEYTAFMERQKQSGGLLQTFIADALGSVIAEHCADAMETHLQQSIDKFGWHHTNRFSPGYCGWPVSEQQQLFPLFGGRTCGVKLTESSLMVPIKSVSGIIGLGSSVSRKDYLCQKGKDGILSCERCRLRNEY